MRQGSHPCCIWHRCVGRCVKRFVDVTNGAFGAPEDQANELSDATKSYIPPGAFATGGTTCPTGMSGAARTATGPGGTCRLNFLHNSGAGVSDSIPRLSAHLFDRLRTLAARHRGLVVEVRGTGLIAGLELTIDAAAVVQGALDRGLLVNRTSGTVVRLLPPYIVTERDIDEMAGVLEAALTA